MWTWSSHIVGECDSFLGNWSYSYDPAFFLVFTEMGLRLIFMQNQHMVFLEALFITGKTWKQPRCPSIGIINTLMLSCNETLFSYQSKWRIKPCKTWRKIYMRSAKWKGEFKKVCVQPDCSSGKGNSRERAERLELRKEPRDKAWRRRAWANVRAGTFPTSSYRAHYTALHHLPKSAEAHHVESGSWNKPWDLVYNKASIVPNEL